MCVALCGCIFVTLTYVYPGQTTRLGCKYCISKLHERLVNNARFRYLLFHTFVDIGRLKVRFST